LTFDSLLLAPPKVVLGHGALNARLAPLWIAHEQKFFAKYEVDSTVLLVRQIQIMVSGLGTGEIDIALTSGSTLLGAAAGGLDAKMVAALNSKVNYDLVVAPSIKTPRICAVSVLAFKSSAVDYGWVPCWGWSIWGSIRSATISMSFKSATSRS
jgi:hypothetical protein